MKKETKWTTAPISPTCEVQTGAAFGIVKSGDKCGKPTRYAYPAWGGGWMALCETHGHKCRNDPGTQKIDDLLAGGETPA